MLQVLDGSARGRSGDRNWSVDAVQPKRVNEAKRRRNFEADMVLARERTCWRPSDLLEFIALLV